MEMKWKHERMEMPRFKNIWKCKIQQKIKQRKPSKIIQISACTSGYLTVMCGASRHLRRDECHAQGDIKTTDTMLSDQHTDGS